MSTQPSDFSGFMIGILVLSFLTVSYFMGMRLPCCMKIKETLAKTAAVDGW